jgi:REP element-mobilizing transposase RayT
MYHITLRGNRGTPLFHDRKDRLTLNKAIGKAAVRYGSEIHAFCWMTNHLHLLLRVGEAPAHRTVHHFASGFARALNRKYDYAGHVFQGRYWSELVATDSYLLAVMRYIHQNPVAGGLVDDAESYEWSSHRDYVEGNRFTWLVTDSVLRTLSVDRQAAVATLKSLVEGPVHSDVPQPDAPWTSLEPKCSSPSSATFNNLVERTCVRFGVTEHDLRSRSKARELSSARAWFARQAQTEGVATVSEVASFLHRSRQALSALMLRWDDEC